MEYLDERIAKIQNEVKMAERRKNLKEKLREENSAAPDKESDLEEATRSVQNGEIKFENMKIAFEEREFYDEKLKWMFPKDFYELRGDKNGVYTFVNKAFRANLMMAYVPNTKKVILSEVKESIKSTMKKSEFNTIWVEDGTEIVKEKTIDYLIFKSPVAGGEIFNIIIYIPIGKDHVIINFNGYEKSIHQWMLISKAMMRTIKIQ